MGIGSKLQVLEFPAKIIFFKLSDDIGLKEVMVDSGSAFGTLSLTAGGNASLIS